MVVSVTETVVAVVTDAVVSVGPAEDSVVFRVVAVSFSVAEDTVVTVE